MSKPFDLRLDKSKGFDYNIIWEKISKKVLTFCVRNNIIIVDAERRREIESENG